MDTVSCSAEKGGVATNRHAVAEQCMLTPLYQISHAVVVHTMLE
jgi:hypothetical protein